MRNSREHWNNAQNNSSNNNHHLLGNPISVTASGGVLIMASQNSNPQQLVDSTRTLDPNINAGMGIILN